MGNKKSSRRLSTAAGTIVQRTRRKRDTADPEEIWIGGEKNTKYLVLGVVVEESGRRNVRAISEGKKENHQISTPEKFFGPPWFKKSEAK